MEQTNRNIANDTMENNSNMPSDDHNDMPSSSQAGAREGNIHSDNVVNGDNGIAHSNSNNGSNRDMYMTPAMGQDNNAPPQTAPTIVSSRTGRPVTIGHRRQPSLHTLDVDISTIGRVAVDRGRGVPSGIGVRDMRDRYYFAARHGSDRYAIPRVNGYNGDNSRRGGRDRINGDGEGGERGGPGERAQGVSRQAERRSQETSTQEDEHNTAGHNGHGGYF